MVSIRITVLVIAEALLTGAATAATIDAAVCFDAAVKGDWSKAVQICSKAAENGDVTSQFNLGLMYSQGLGVAQDYAQAVRWYTMAARQGYSEAQNNLGLMYSKGQGVIQDYAQAFRWYKSAAEQGHVLAQNNLGSMYGNGLGITQDYLRAHMWYNLAAVSGNDDSVRGRDIAASRMTREQIAEAQKLARECSLRKYRNC